MPQILVGGDNQDAYSICDAVEKMGAPRGLSVVFCATPQEVLSTVGRGGTVAAVLNFEKAGLTNFELACRIRESADGSAVPLLLPQVDALGDVGGTLGKRVAVFAFPVEPGVIAALTLKLLDGPAAAVAAPAASPGASPAKPSPAGAAKPAPGSAAKLTGPAGAPPPAAALADTGRPSPSRAESEAAIAERASAPRQETPTRSRRVRHRSWHEVRSPHREPPPPPEPDDADEEEPVPVVRRAAASSARGRLGRLLLVFGVLLVAALSYLGVRYLGADRDTLAAVPEGKLALMCVACDAREERPVQNIHEILCRKCGGKMGFAFHCNDCNKDFGCIPEEKVKTLGDLKSKPACSLCKSWNTKAVQPSSATGSAKGGSAAAKPAAKAGAAPAKGTEKPGTAPAKAPAKAGSTPAKAPDKAASAPAKAPDKAGAAPAAKPPAKPAKSSKPAGGSLDE